MSDSEVTRAKKRASQLRLRRLRQQGNADALAGKPRASQHPSYIRGYLSGEKSALEEVTVGAQHGAVPVE